MRRVLVTSGPRFLGSRAILRLLTAGSEMRGMKEDKTRAAEKPTTVVAGDVQRSPRASFIAARRDQDAESVDAIAGSEFVDDRIRLRE